jgi:putative sigma-54 modulation protein
MSIDVNWGALDFNKESRNIVSRQLQYLLERYRAVTLRVRVRFSDVNGPRGGFDKKCVVSLKLRRPGEIIIKGQGVNYLEVFQTSFERLVCAVRREIVKQREKPIRINRRKISL